MVTLQMSAHLTDTIDIMNKIIPMNTMKVIKTRTDTKQIVLVDSYVTYSNKYRLCSVIFSLANNFINKISIIVWLCFNYLRRMRYHLFIIQLYNSK